MGGPVRPAPSEFDGGVLALVRIWHGMKGTGRRLHPFTPSSNCGILQLTLQDEASIANLVQKGTTLPQ